MQRAGGALQSASPCRELPAAGCQRPTLTDICMHTRGRHPRREASHPRTFTHTCTCMHLFECFE